MEVFIVICAIGVAWYHFHKTSEENKEYDAKQEARRKEEEKRRIQKWEEEKKNIQKREYERAQETTYNKLGNIVLSSKMLSQNLSKEIESAEKFLDAAEQEYAEGVFAPFWDNIEYAVTHLAHFDRGVNLIAQNCSQYKIEKEKLDSTPPVFKLNIETLPNATVVANRMRGIVRKAQGNFQFATIYEQRKTNQLLVSGFTNLAQALGEMSYRIGQSIYSLSTSITDLSDTTADSAAKIIKSSEQGAQDIVGSINAVSKQLKVDAETRRDHEKEESEMLDNIQRHRKLSPV